MVNREPSPRRYSLRATFACLLFGFVFGHLVSLRQPGVILAPTTTFAKLPSDDREGIHTLVSNLPAKRQSRTSFDEYLQKYSPGTGGLTNDNRQFLLEAYGQAHSVLEFGIGESTQIATAQQVPLYVGMDSSPEWIESVRAKAPPDFSLVLTNIGPTKEWGNPVSMPNNETSNQTSSSVNPYPLEVLSKYDFPFDVYFVDGRFRLACVIASLLHGSRRSRVFLHDCFRRTYHKHDHLFHVTAHGNQLNAAGKVMTICEFKARENVTTEQLLEAYREREWIVY